MTEIIKSIVKYIGNKVKLVLSLDYMDGEKYEFTPENKRECEMPVEIAKRLIKENPRAFKIVGEIGEDIAESDTSDDDLDDDTDITDDDTDADADDEQIPVPKSLEERVNEASEVLDTMTKKEIVAYADDAFKGHGLTDKMKKEDLVAAVVEMIKAADEAEPDGE